MLGFKTASYRELWLQLFTVNCLHICGICLFKELLLHLLTSTFVISQLFILILSTIKQLTATF